MRALFAVLAFIVTSGMTSVLAATPVSDQVQVLAPVQQDITAFLQRNEGSWIGHGRLIRDYPNQFHQTIPYSTETRIWPTLRASWLVETFSRTFDGNVNRVLSEMYPSGDRLFIGTQGHLEPVNLLPETDATRLSYWVMTWDPYLRDYVRIETRIGFTPDGNLQGVRTGDWFGRRLFSDHFELRRRFPSVELN